MRTAIFIGATIIGMSINPELKIGEEVSEFLLWSFMIFACADIIDIFKSK